VPARVFATDIQNIEHTMLLTAGDRLHTAMSEIHHARQILIVGSGVAAALVEFLAYSLQVMDLPVRTVTNGEEPLTLALAFLQPEDVLIGISFRRNPGYVIRAFEEARAVGAKSIGITDSEVSPVVQVADYPFVVVASRVAPVASPVAAASLLNAFIAVLSSEGAEQISHSVEQVDSAYRRSGLSDE
jgi:DNA-binding MurR/RpiR family transcriptional regulator